MPAATKRVLVVGPAWIGDMVLAQSLYKFLKQHDAATEIDVVAPAWSKALLGRMPEVSRTIEMPAAHGELRLRARWRLGAQLRRNGYERAIVLPRSLKSALLPWFARVPVRTGFRGEMRYGLINDMRTLDRAAMPKMVTRYIALGRPPGAPAGEIETPTPALAVDEAARAAYLEKAGLKGGEEGGARVLALMPGAAYGRAKRWPAEYFAEVARRLGGDGWQVWVFGADAEHAAGEQIKEALPAAVNLCGRTTLEEAIDLMSLADLAVTNDSGLMHIAAAVGCPLVAIYGSSVPAYAPPMSAHATQLWRDLECSPCRSRTCRYGHYRCLTEITPDAVLAAAAALSSPARTASHSIPVTASSSP